MLKTTLEAALLLTDQMAADGMLARLIGTFAQMPEADRAVVLGAFEREVRARQLSLATEG